MTHRLLCPLTKRPLVTADLHSSSRNRNAVAEMHGLSKALLPLLCTIQHCLRPLLYQLPSMHFRSHHTQFLRPYLAR